MFPNLIIVHMDAANFTKRQTNINNANTIEEEKKNPLNQNGHSDNPQFCLEEKKSLIIFCNDYDAFAAISHDFFLAIASSPMTT